MHNKVFIADNALAIFGGRNIGNEYFLRAEDGNFLDLDVLTAGDAVLAPVGLIRRLLEQRVRLADRRDRGAARRPSGAAHEIRRGDVDTRATACPSAARAPESVRHRTRGTAQRRVDALRRRCRGGRRPGRQAQRHARRPASRHGPRRCRRRRPRRTVRGLRRLALLHPRPSRHGVASPQPSQRCAPAPAHQFACRHRRTGGARGLPRISSRAARARHGDLRAQPVDGSRAAAPRALRPERAARQGNLLRPKPHVPGFDEPRWALGTVQHRGRRHDPKHRVDGGAAVGARLRVGQLPSRAWSRQWNAVGRSGAMDATPSSTASPRRDSCES